MAKRISWIIFKLGLKKRDCLKSQDSLVFIRIPIRESFQIRDSQMVYFTF
jgi:hypothetical protein